MKMTNTEIVNRHAALLQIGKKHLPRKVCYAIARNITALEHEVKLIKAQIGDIAEKYALKDENGKFILEHTSGGRPSYTFQNPADATAFERECQIMNEIEIDVAVFTVSAGELDKYEEDTRYDCLTPVEEATLEWMLEYN